ncbi:hypothetical protein ScPMuIL_015648 [Solemya velum]
MAVVVDSALCMTSVNVGLFVDVWQKGYNPRPSLMAYSKRKMSRAPANEIPCTRFITEVKKFDGNEFPPKTLLEIIVAIQKHLEIDGKPLKLLRDTRFSELPAVLDATMKDRTAKGLGLQKKQADVISHSDELDMWDKGYFTNHSLRASCASRLFENGVDEQLVMERTGHRSLAVRRYKRTSNKLVRSVSEIVVDDKKRQYEDDTSECSINQKSCKLDTKNCCVVFNLYIN